MRFIFKTDYAQDLRLVKHGGHIFWYGLLCLALVAAPWLLGEYTCRIDRCVNVDEPCVILGWKIEVKGRRSIVGTSLHGQDGVLCALAKGVWIEPRVPIY